MRNIIIIACALLLNVTNAFGVDKRFTFDFDTSAVWNTNNKVEIPRDTGTRFSLTDTVDVKPKLAIRFRAMYWLSERHSLSFIYAPLSLRGSGTLANDVAFNNSNFPKNSNINALYRFNSYRLNFAYTWVDTKKVRFRVGATAKIRDAEIAISDSNTNSSKKNVGFVPLAYLGFAWKINNWMEFETDLDAMIAPQGRAEDLYLGLLWHLSPLVSLKTGYRLIEGGANVAQVYNFALLQYLTLGLRLNI